jgi:D-methionine transport system permease protein
MLLAGLWQTLYMTVASTAAAYAAGLPLGVILAVTDKSGLKPVPWLNAALGFAVNTLRSVPFLILLIVIMPVTRAIIGTTIGSAATVVPLVAAAAPFIARLTESALKEVDAGVVEAASGMGASAPQIIFKVLIPEARSGLMLGAAISLVTILGYSAMAGVCGGGGLGDIAIRYGYYRYESGTMLITAALLAVVVQIFQEIGTRLSRAIDMRLN